MMNNKNIVWINNMKSICLIGVFFVHCQLYYGFMFDKINFLSLKTKKKYLVLLQFVLYLIYINHLMFVLLLLHE